MKSIIKDLSLGLLLATIIALLETTLAELAFDFITIFAFLVLLTIMNLIKNKWVSFAVLTVVSVGVSLYDINFVIYCLPSALLVWSALLCKKEKVSPVFTILEQIGFVVSLYFCYTNRNTGINASNFFVEVNKFVLIPIVIIIFVLLQNYNKDSDEDDSEDEDGDDTEAIEESLEIIPIDKSKKILMTCAYIWSIIFLVDMAFRFKTTINVTLPWVCAMCYVISLEEPMLMNAFPFLKTIFNFGGTSEGANSAIDLPVCEETNADISTASENDAENQIINETDKTNEEKSDDEAKDAGSK